MAAASTSGSGVLEKSERRKCLDDTTPLLASIATFKIRPKDNVTVKKPSLTDFELLLLSY